MGQWEGIEGWRGTGDWEKGVLEFGNRCISNECLVFIDIFFSRNQIKLKLK